MLPDFEFRPNGEGTEPVYRFRRPTVAERNFGFARAVRAKGGVYHSEFARLAALEQGVKALLGDEPAMRDRFLATVAEYRAKIQAALQRRAAEAKSAETVLPPKAAEELTDEEKRAAAERAAVLLAEANALLEGARAVQEIADLVRRGFPRYAEMEADCEAYFAIRGHAAIELFGRDIDLEAIPEEHVPAIGVWCQALFAPGDAQRKNSSSPSPSAATAKNATSSSPSVP